MRKFPALKFLRIFSRGFEKFGIDYEAMEKILKMKLMMDARRVPTIFNETSKKKEGNQLLKSLWIYGLYGLILIPFIYIGDNYIFQMSIVFGMVMFILMTSMISDFSSVLLDVRDKYILYTKPIHHRTISAAKIVHVVFYMGLITGAFVLIPVIVSLFRQGLGFTLLFLLTLLLMMLFVIVLTALLYLFVLRFFDGERLKDIINYVQIILSVGILVGYQILIRSFDVVSFDMIYSFSWWHVFIPPLWFSAPFDFILHQNYDYSIILMSAFAVVMPIISISLYIKLMPTFEQNLEKLMSDIGKARNRKYVWDEICIKLFCRHKEEKMFYRFTSMMMRQEREFKLKVYPSIGMSLVFPFIFIFNELRYRPLADISTGKLFLFIYFCNLLIPTAVHMLRFSGSYKGSWLLKAAPVVNESSAYSGALKAFLVKLYVPTFVLVSLVFTFIFSGRILPDLIAVFLAGIVQTLISYKLINNETYPFSRPFEIAQDAGGVKLLLPMIIIGLFVVVHTLTFAASYGIYVYIAILLIAVYLSWHAAFPKQKRLKVT